MRIDPLGDRACIVTLGTSIDAATNRLVRAATARLRERPLEGLIDLVPAFASVAVHYEPALVPDRATPAEWFADALRESLADLAETDLPAARRVEIPVCYGADFGPDLDDVARLHDLTAEEVVHAHASATYLVYMIGFMPGFAYLGGLPPNLVTPRRSSPRMAVPAGAVGIGGQQTGVYPMVSPGGWNLIGRTPVRVFDIAREQPSMLDTGDEVSFVRIDRAEYDRLLA